MFFKSILSLVQKIFIMFSQSRVTMRSYFTFQSLRYDKFGFEVNFLKSVGTIKLNSDTGATPQKRENYLLSAHNCSNAFVYR